MTAKTIPRSDSRADKIIGLHIFTFHPFFHITIDFLPCSRHCETGLEHKHKYNGISAFKGCLVYVGGRQITIHWTTITGQMWKEITCNGKV